MAKRLFNLRQVPADEANEVRALLAENAIEFYETPERFWVFSMAAIWLKNNDDFAKARALLDNYQAQRSEQQRQRYLADKASGQASTVVRLFLNNPLRFILALLGIAVILYLSIKPFLSLINSDVP